MPDGHSSTGLVNACSLRADVDRLAFSVLWEMTPDAEVVSTAFTKSIIRSCAALTYEEAQNRINDTARSDTVTLSLRELLRVSRILRKRRCVSPPPRPRPRSHHAASAGLASRWTSLIQTRSCFRRRAACDTPHGHELNIAPGSG